MPDRKDIIPDAALAYQLFLLEKNKEKDMRDAKLQLMVASDQMLSALDKMKSFGSEEQREALFKLIAEVQSLTETIE